MTQALFVHNDTRLLDRLAKESSAKALITTSMMQALQWITNPDCHLSGVFVSPDDATFSTLRFLEITLNQRPALPIFLFEPQLSVHQDQAHKIMKNVHVKGVFSGSEPYQTLMSSLKDNLLPSDEIRKKPTASAQMPGYVAVPISDFFTSEVYPYDLFIFDPPSSLNLFAQQDTEADSIYLSRASQKTDFLYVKEADIKKKTNDIKTLKSNYLDSELPSSWKTAEVMVNSKQVLNEMKSVGVNDQLIEYTQTMLGDLFKLISTIDSDEGSISSIIDKAKQCDRSVYCASYSILLCKQLRFEKTATLEILGLASVLQDISLYHTPYGDLSDKLISEIPADQLGYFLQHPKLSADLVALHTDVPQVTLQVVRQHHERKDATGFPNHVGGSQLHPMAEILSLINSYYEVSKKMNQDSLSIQELQTLVFPHYSETVVNAFKVVLGTIVKDSLKNHTRL